MPAPTVRIFSRSSRASRSASFPPTPFTCFKRATSLVAIARTSSAVSIPARIASATRGPTPCTLSNVWNSPFSAVVEKPYRRNGSSVTKCA